MYFCVCKSELHRGRPDVFVHIFMLRAATPKKLNVHSMCAHLHLTVALCSESPLSVGVYLYVQTVMFLLNVLTGADMSVNTIGH